jgi:hypothetical protein
MSRARVAVSSADRFDAHDKAFQFFKGQCTRGIYDKTAVNAIYVGKERQFNRRFL